MDFGSERRKYEDEKALERDCGICGGIGLILLILLAILTALAIFGGSIMHLFGFRYLSVGKAILFFVVATVVSYPINLIAGALPDALYHLNKITRDPGDDFIPVVGYRSYRIGTALRGLFYGFCVSYGDFCFCGISSLCARGYPESSERETENEIARISRECFWGSLHRENLSELRSSGVPPGACENRNPAGVRRSGTANFYHLAFRSQRQRQVRKAVTAGQARYDGNTQRFCDLSDDLLTAAAAGIRCTAGEGTQKDTAAAADLFGELQRGGGSARDGKFFLPHLRGTEFFLRFRFRRATPGRRRARSGSLRTDGRS